MIRVIRVMQSTEADELRALDFILTATEANDE